MRRNPFDVTVSAQMAALYDSLPEDVQASRFLFYGLNEMVGRAVDARGEMAAAVITIVRHQDQLDRRYAEEVGS